MASKAEIAVAMAARKDIVPLTRADVLGGVQRVHMNDRHRPDGTCYEWRSNGRVQRSTGQTLGYVTEWHGGRWWYSGADWERDDLPDTRAAAARALLRQHGSPRHRRRRRS
jgi:hypothetical protein